MIVLYILLGILAFALLLLLIPVHVKAQFDGALCVRVRYAFVFVTLYPRPERPGKKQKKEKEKKRKVSSKKAPSKEKKEKELSQWELLLREGGPTGVVHAAAELAKLAGTAIRRIFAAITVDRLELRLIIASEDAADTAVGYGKACAVLYPALAVLESVVKVRCRDIAVAPDFLKQKGEFSGEIRLHAVPLRILWAGLRLIAAYIGNTFKQQIKKQDELPAGPR